jgi:hypothetical protein
MVGRGTAADFPRGGTAAATPTYLEVVGAKRLFREFGDSLEAANGREPVPFVFDYTFDAPGHPQLSRSRAREPHGVLVGDGDREHAAAAEARRAEADESERAVPAVSVSGEWAPLSPRGTKRLSR